VRMCRGRTSTGEGNDSMCVDWWYGFTLGGAADATVKVSDLTQKLGINAFGLIGLGMWLKDLYAQGLIGKGKQIDSSLPFDQMGQAVFGEALLNSIVDQTDIGADLSLGLWQCAKKWDASSRTWQPASCRCRSGATCTTTTAVPRPSGATAP